MTYEMELTNSELREVGKILCRVPGGKIRNAEALDGFFAALICCPESIMPGEYMAVLLNGDMENNDHVFESKEELKKFCELVNRQRNHISRQLHSENAYVPFVLEDEDGKFQANDWAQGFLFGTELREELWHDLIMDEEEGISMFAIWALAYEHDEDRELRPFDEPVSDKQRMDLLVGAAVGVKFIFELFSKQRESYARPAEAIARSGPKPGRNAPCPCGSGRKIKQCCGRRSMLQ